MPADQRFSIPARQLEQHFQHACVGNGAAEDLHVLDLTGHHRTLDAFVLEEANHLSQLANTYPNDVVRNALDLRVGFLANGGNRKRNTGSPRPFNNQKRKATIAGNKTVVHRNREGFGLWL